MSVHGFDKVANIGYTDSAKTGERGAFCFLPLNHIIYGQSALSHEDSRPVIRLSNGGNHAGGRFAMEQERWKAISGYKGFYEVSDRGRVRSLDRVVACCGGYIGHWRGRVLKPGNNPNGYPTAGLCMGSVQENIGVHQLVARAFIGEQLPGYEVNHIDGNPANNQANNLEWVTRSENQRHAYDNGLHPKTAILTPKLAEQIRALHATGEYTNTQLGPMFGVHPGTVGDVVRGKSWPT